jgi:hypothetical protein
MARQVEEMGEDSQNKLKINTDNCSYFSLQLSESPEIVDTYPVILFKRNTRTHKDKLQG